MIRKVDLFIIFSIISGVAFIFLTFPTYSNMKTYVDLKDQAVVVALTALKESVDDLKKEVKNINQLKGVENDRRRDKRD